jgi:hypothetical protein
MAIRELDSEISDYRIAMYTPGKVFFPHIGEDKMDQFECGGKTVSFLQTGIYNYKLTELALVKKGNLNFQVFYHFYVF